MTNEDLRMLQLTQLEILNEVDRICKLHNIKYYLDSGTLLGAIRHKGFIPWDDDLDICMLRNDYIKFQSVVESECFNDKYEFQCWHNDKYYGLPFGKMLKKNSTFVCKDNEFTKAKKKIFIDIFPVDCIPDNKWNRIFQKISLDILSRGIKAKLNYSPWNNKNGVDIKKKSCFNIIKLLLIPIPSTTLVNLYEKISTYYNSGKCHLLGWNSPEKWGEITSIASLFDKTELVPFENDLFPAFADYDLYLKSLYGNYHELPPLEKRENVHNSIIVNFDNYIFD